MPAGTHSREEWTAIASGLELRRGAFIDGELVDAAREVHRTEDDLDQFLTMLVKRDEKGWSWR